MKNFNIIGVESFSELRISSEEVIQFSEDINPLQNRSVITPSINGYFSLSAIRYFSVAEMNIIYFSHPFFCYF